jgi:hypothetical protein
VREPVGVEVGACPVDHLLRRLLSIVYGEDRILLCGAGDARGRLPLLTTDSCCVRLGEARGDKRLGAGSRLFQASQSDAYETASEAGISS